ncbi:MAG: DUF2892 domain-containing protein [Pseudomonadota bacterium]
MTCNVGHTERMVRIALGILLLLLAFFGILGGVLAYLGGVIGLVLIATAGMKFCPLYRLVGFSTCADET